MERRGYGDPSNYSQRVNCPPTIVELGPDLADGEKLEERQLLERLIAALAPLRKQGTPEVEASLVLMGATSCSLHGGESTLDFGV